MNFLAHLYLSGSSADVRMGNFIGDSVKGNGHIRFKPDVQKGILMHREIDSYTDNHLNARMAGAIIKPVYGRYSGVVTDLFFDHFLAKNWALYSPQPLHHFVDEVHKQLLARYFQLPNNVKGFLPFMIKSRRLENYKDFDSLERSLQIMSNHSSLPPLSQEAIVNLQENYERYEELFFTLFADVVAHCEIWSGNYPAFIELVQTKMG